MVHRVIGIGAKLSERVTYQTLIGGEQMKRSIELTIAAGIMLCNTESIGMDGILQSVSAETPQRQYLTQQIQEEISTENWSKAEASLTDMPRYIFEDFIRNNTLYFSKDIYDAFKIALKNGWTHLCELIIEKESDVLNFEYYDEESPLHIAVVDNHKKMVEVLVKEGVDVNIYYQGNTQLHEADWTDNPQIGQLLIELGADTDARDALGYTPLEIAVMRDHVNIAALLLEKEFNRGNEFIYDAMLRFAFAHNSKRVINLILKKNSISTHCV